VSEPREERLSVGWGELAITRFGDPAGKKLLCLHGWMDNAASFEPLARSLPQFEWVALDSAGHGASDHRPAPGRYYLTDYFLDIDPVLDALGWNRCNLISHSMGTGVAACYACADPERIERVAMIDGIGIATEPADEAGHRLVRSLQSTRAPRDHRRAFESVDQAADARRIKNPMRQASARLLSQRALRKDTDGWRWRTDPRAMWASPYWMTEAQAMTILHGVSCPVFATVTPFLEDYLGDRLGARLGAMPGARVLHIDGGHHVHMDEPERIAPALADFLDPGDPEP